MTSINVKLHRNYTITITDRLALKIKINSQRQESNGKWQKNPSIKILVV